MQSLREFEEPTPLTWYDSRNNVSGPDHLTAGKGLMASPGPNPMSARIEYTSEGLIAVTISGKFSQDEWSKMQTEAGRLIEQHGPVRILVVADQFQGWERKGDWGDV